MKLDIRILPLAAALVLPLAACTQEASNAAGSTSQGVANAAKDMGGKMTEAAKQFGVQFDDLKKMADGKLAGADASIADLKKKAEAKSGEAKTQIDGLVQQLMSKKDEIAKLFAGIDVKSLDMKSIEGLKAKVEPVLAELQKLLDKAKTM